jgi:hypothetical protein
MFGGRKMCVQRFRTALLYRQIDAVVREWKETLSFGAARVCAGAHELNCDFGGSKKYVLYRSSVRAGDFRRKTEVEPNFSRVPLPREK